MSETDYKEIKKWLGRGGITDLARETGKSKNGMTYILSTKAKSPNVEVLKRAVQIALKNQNDIMMGIAKMRENEKLIESL